MTNVAHEAIENKVVPDDELPIKENVLGGEAGSAVPDVLGGVVMQSDQSEQIPQTDQLSSEPSTADLIAKGEIPKSTDQVITPKSYAQPPSIASLFAVGLKREIGTAIDEKDKDKDKAVDTVFVAIKDIVKVFADTMRERKLVPEYAFERIQIPEEPTGLRKLFGMKQNSDGVRLTPYWPILIHYDLSGNAMESYSDSGYVIGARPDGSLIYLVKSHRDGYVCYGDMNDFSTYTVNHDGLVRPEDMFNTYNIPKDPSDYSRQTKIITTLEQRLYEQGVVMLKRTKTNLGYEPVILRHNKQLDQYVK